MTLRRRLVLLHSAFAVFAVGAAVATIYAVQLRTEEAAEHFSALVNEAHRVEELRIDLKKLDVHLHEIVVGTRALDAGFRDYSSDCLARLGEVAHYSMKGLNIPSAIRQDMQSLYRDLNAALGSFVGYVEGENLVAASEVFKHRIEHPLLDQIDDRLQQTRNHADIARQQASGRLLARDTQLLIIALMIAVCGVGLVVTGALIVRRRLVTPIGEIQAATAAFTAGDLDHRIALKSSDELGLLGAAMNQMAGALQTSQRKYQSLFENLRDTVIICDARGTVVECHDGDAGLLGNEHCGAVGQRAGKVWDKWRFSVWSWPDLIGRVLASDDPIRLNDIPLGLADGRHVVVDIVAYCVEYASVRYVAVVLRDVTERHKLQRAVLRSETMEASVNFARGLAHDFKNLLHSAAASLSLVAEQTEEPQTLERTRTALEACRQASGLSRRLTRFAASDETHPEQLCLSEMARVIVDSLDECFLDGVRLDLDCQEAVGIFVDRDQLTQVFLNLLYNAREAMPNGGLLSVQTGVVDAADPVSGESESPHAMLTVSDTGVGMTEDVVKHAFEPLFSTNPRGEHGPRGIGLAVVYAAVKNAGGFITVDSRPSHGTTFRVCLPLCGNHITGV